MKKFVICIKNDNYQASLDKWKLYIAIEDKKAEALNYIRIIDETGEDYIYPKDYFELIAVPEVIQTAYVAEQSLPAF